MASDDKKTETSPAPKNETAVKKEAAAKKKDEGQRFAPHMSAFGGKADIPFCTAYVR